MLTAAPEGPKTKVEGNLLLACVIDTAQVHEVGASHTRQTYS